MSRIEVAVAAPLSKTFSYSCDLEEVGNPIGRRVLISFGKQRLTGYVLGLQPEEDVAFRILPVHSFLDPSPLFPENLVPFFRWIANYYHFPIGEVIKTALPGGLSPKNRSILRLIEKEMGTVPVWPENEQAAPQWYEKLVQEKQLSAAQSKKLLKDKRWVTLFKKWREEGLVEIVDVLSKETVGAKKELCYRVNAKIPLPSSEDKAHLKEMSGQEANGTKLTIPMLRTLYWLSTLAKEQGRELVAAKDVRKKYSGASRALNTLEESGIIKSQQRRIFRNPFGEPLRFYPEPKVLTKEQDQVLSSLLPAITKKSFHTFLLHGVTGCGKTEVYLQAAAKTLQAGRDVLVLVPEIALATQLEAHFVSRFKDQVVVLHSGLSKGERFDQWSLAASGKGKIVIGARSAVFAPLADPGLIVVDEEHDSAYKQDDGLRYQGRDLAILRGHMNQAVVLLGSGTPTISSYAKAREGKFSLLTMQKRVENRPLPEITIVDLKDKEANTRGDCIGRELESSLALNLQNEKQSILLLNRRGFSSTYLCRDCGEPVRCAHCHVSLTYHKRHKKLICHYCGFSLVEGVVCSGCRSSNLIPVGFGTERVEDEVRRKFPEARVARIDSDSAADRKKFLALLKQMHDRQIDILIGTQMIAKGHDFPHVTLVGVIWADGGLTIPDFRGAERSYQLLSQVAGRAGRGKYPGKVIIQTLRPEHYAIQLAAVHDYNGLFDKEIELRKNPLFPPFVRLANIRFSGSIEAQVQATATRVAILCQSKKDKNTEILGPAPSPIDRLRDRYRWQLLLKAKETAKLHEMCSLILEHYPSLCKGDIRIALDVDPESMM